ncbi:Mechanosensitive ion channel protein [Fusarium keratoplasticum]|uniref:Mechanosensitive ion channel protein n=1 Tax=Fusarium keratoplasticum TaxID=1328300 RepID=A0ACC0QNI5_9HYPO|nr:Mechanosensitive ion channel protein [Fusarium keratoplasticum]KAI8657795.1 Mechanosensitive ion channel protein [Fusarium keratoplasticum]KAI8658755.1 Mechanosensitive ion channel protein [Fusarium keratoplasticum]
MTGTDPPPPDGKEFKLQQPPPSRQPSQQTTQHPRRTDSPRLGEDEKISAPMLDTFPTLAAPNDTNDSSSNTVRSPSGQRADASRIDDNLELLRVERAVSAEDHDGGSHMRKRAHNVEPEDAFNVTLPDEKTFHDNRKRDPDAALLKFWIFLRKFPRFVRYCLYLFPGAALLLIPVLLGGFAFKNGERDVGGVDLMWFGIWLEIVWGVLWVSRMITSLMPPTFKLVAKLSGSTTPKKWKDIGYQLDLHTAVFLWFLAILISFEPTMTSHNYRDKKPHWVTVVNKVIIALFVLATLNFVEKILIQWIASSFHQRTYATRIDNNKTDIGQLVRLYEHAKAKNEQTDYFFQRGSGSASGAQTPMQTLQDNARQAWNKVGYVAGRVGNDLIGRKVDSNHPRRVVNELLKQTPTAHTLARLIYRSTVREGRDLVYLEDLQAIFTAEEEAEVAFMMFDKDMNGDISVDEFEAVCNEIHLEKKAIAASLKDLDSVIKKLDKVFMFIIVVITIIVFISILSGSAAAALGSAGTVVLGLAWVLQATAQEFLQSIIFVFVKHPFDVGDRVTVYGSTGDTMMGDDYYVTEISLLYTEFKKMQGHIVQAPNSLLNNLFILNQRRSNGLADVVSLVMRFGTPQHMIDELKERMTDFCLANKRDYQPRIITEMTTLNEVRSCSMNLIFFHKTNFQNELLRLNRHNKFVTELMTQMVNIGIQSPFRNEPGGSREHPMYWTGMQPPPAYGKEQDHGNVDPLDNHSQSEGPALHRFPSTYSRRSERQRSVDDNMNDFQDVFENRRDNVHAQRLAMIREKERASRIEEERESIASSSGVARRISTESRSRVFGRTRTGSKSRRPADMV